MVDRCSQLAGLTYIYGPRSWIIFVD